MVHKALAAAVGLLMFTGTAFAGNTNIAIGNNSQTARIYQIGAYNRALIVQGSTNNSALVIQFGVGNGAVIIQN